VFKNQRFLKINKPSPKNLI